MITQVIRGFSSNTEISFSSSLTLLIWHSQQLTLVPWDKASQWVTETPLPALKLLVPRTLAVVCPSLNIVAVRAWDPGSVVNFQHCCLCWPPLSPHVYLAHLGSDLLMGTLMLLCWRLFSGLSYLTLLLPCQGLQLVMKTWRENSWHLFLSSTFIFWII